MSSQIIQLSPIRLRNDNDYTKGFEPSDLVRLLKESQPDIIHCMSDAHNPYVHQVAWLARLHRHKAKVLFYAFENKPLSQGLRMRAKLALPWQLLAGGAAATQGAVDVLRRAGFPQKKPIDVIPYGIDSSTFQSTTKCAARELLGLPYKKLVGYCGRLVPEKGLLTLLDALTKTSPEIHCVLIGSGPQQAELENQAHESGLDHRVHFIDFQPQDKISAYMSAMDAFVLPSLTTHDWMEQYGMVLVEAMTVGTPVVGSSSGAIPDVIGDGGMVFAESDPIELAKCIDKICSDDHYGLEMSRKALARASNLTSTHMAEQMVSLYSRLLSKRS